MVASDNHKDQAQSDSFKKELISKLFPEQAERDRLESLAKSKSVGEIKARIAIHQLFSPR